MTELNVFLKSIKGLKLINMTHINEILNDKG